MSSFLSLFIDKLSLFKDHWIVVPLKEHWIVALFLLANLAISFWAHTQAKKNSFEDYALASRSLPTGVLTLSVLATLATVGSLRQPGYMYTVGVVAIFNQVCVIAQLVCMGTFIAPYLVYYPSCMTMGDLMATFYGRAARILAGVLSSLFCLLIVSTQLHAIGKMSYVFFGVAPSTATIGLGGFIVLYSVWGGIRSVSYTDVLQAVALLILFSWVAQVILQRIGGVQKMVEALPKEKAAFFSHPNFFQLARESLVWAFYPLSCMAPPFVQRMLMTQDKRTVRKVWYTNAFLITFFSCMVILIGLGAIAGMKQFNLTGKEGRTLFLDLIPKLFTQKWVINCMFIGCLAILFSTMDSYLHALGIGFVQDIITPFFELSSTKNPRLKTSFARITIALAGLLTIVMGLLGINPHTNALYRYMALLLSVVLVIPLIIGILGIKTDGVSLVAFCAIYLVSLLGFHTLKWPLSDYFFPSMLLGILAYFTIHIYRNGGIATLKRSKQTISEQLWMPSWKGVFKYWSSGLWTPSKWHILASRKTINNPTYSLSFSLLIFALYTLSSILTGGSQDLGIVTFMVGIHVVGITLCMGLLLEGIWPSRLKPYFSLYWFFTLLYCLPLGGTLAFLRVHKGPLSTLLFVGSFMVLAFLVDSQLFYLLSVSGSFLAMLIWWLIIGGLPHDLWNEYTLTSVGMLILLLSTIFLFNRRREEHANQRLAWNRTSSGILAHDLRSTVQMQNSVGTLLKTIFSQEQTATNTKGEPGCWVSKEHAKFLKTSGENLIKKSSQARQDIHNFMEFMERQIMGWLEQEKIQMHQVVKKAVKRVQDQYKERMKITLSCSKDFEAHSFSIFPNLIINLLDNASRHGKATKVEIDIDGAKRTLTLRDNGKGIAADVLPRIFDLNFSTGKQKKAHSGLGLAFIKMIVHASSGKISCHSRAGDSDSFTEFVISFPET